MKGQLEMIPIIFAAVVVILIFIFFVLPAFIQSCDVHPAGLNIICSWFGKDW
jgi:hypothetical protein